MEETGRGTGEEIEEGEGEVTKERVEPDPNASTKKEITLAGNAGKRDILQGIAGQEETEKRTKID